MDSDNPCIGSNSIPGCLLARGSRCADNSERDFFSFLLKSYKKQLTVRFFSLYHSYTESEKGKPLPLLYNWNLGMARSF